jgi:TonB family protein
MTARVKGPLRQRCAFAVAALLGAMVACADADADLELPALVTTELPFEYPPSLYLQQAHGDVTLRLFVDSLGRVVADSTTVAEPAAHEAFDSSAVRGAPQLQFRPARRGDRRVGAAVLFPIKFRVPGAPPPPGDTAVPVPSSPPK